MAVIIAFTLSPTVLLQCNGFSPVFLASFHIQSTNSTVIYPTFQQIAAWPSEQRAFPTFASLCLLHLTTRYLSQWIWPPYIHFYFYTLPLCSPLITAIHHRIKIAFPISLISSLLAVAWSLFIQQISLLSHPHCSVLLTSLHTSSLIIPVSFKVLRYSFNKLLTHPLLFQ